MKILSKVVLVLVLFFFSLDVYALTDTSRASVVIDMDSGRILYENNKDEKLLIASTTKIMTAVIAIENKNLNEVVTIGEEVLPMYGSNIYIEVGEQMTLRDLLYGLILRSGNDAAVSIAKYVGKSEENFVKMMNEKAKKLGMTNTVFKNPHGLDDDTENYSTAYDMAILMKYAYTLMDFVEISGTRKWSVTTNKKSYVWYNRNSLLTEYKYATGGKTGYTPKAGKTLVSTASKDDLNLVAVTLNDGNHYKTQESLYEYVFSNYNSIKVIDKNNSNFENDLYDNLYVKYSFSYPLRDDELEDIKTYIDLYKLDDYENNDKVGEIYVVFKDEEVYRENVYVKTKEKEKKGFLEVLKDFFNSIF